MLPSSTSLVARSISKLELAGLQCLGTHTRMGSPALLAVRRLGLWPVERPILGAMVGARAGPAQTVLWVYRVVDLQNERQLYRCVTHAADPRLYRDYAPALATDPLSSVEWEHQLVVVETSQLHSMHGPPPNCKRFEVGRSAVRVNVSGL